MNLLQQILWSINGIIKRYPQQHLHNELQHTPEKKGTAQDIPVFIYIRSTVYRCRSSVLPPVLKSLKDIIILDSLKFLENGDPFVISDNPAPHRLIALCYPQSCIILSVKTN
ncbi:unnamed protein product [Rotaria socialis]|uniref:Uncharacterized protein n=1 Tax=Rotaria socialis TaxID=392032 RepID=A0A821TSE4_9BILA|nr:unnamed protein product [Rotaria socialis]